VCFLVEVNCGLIRDFVPKKAANYQVLFPSGSMCSQQPSPVFHSIILKKNDHMKVSRRLKEEVWLRYLANTKRVIPRSKNTLPAG